MKKILLGSIAAAGLLYLATRKRKKKDSNVSVEIKNPTPISRKHILIIASACGVTFYCGYLLARRYYKLSYEEASNQGAIHLVSQLVKNRFPEAGVVYHRDHFTNGRDFEDDVMTFLQGIGLKEGKNLAVVERDELGLWFKYII